MPSFIDERLLNGKALAKPVPSHESIVRGGTLRLVRLEMTVRQPWESPLQPVSAFRIYSHLLRLPFDFKYIGTAKRQNLVCVCIKIRRICNAVVDKFDQAK